MKTKKKWFAVKTLYRTRPVGRPNRPDRDYDHGGSLVEERVVMFRAVTHADAIERAEREAREYARPTHRNAYGQRVITRYLGHCDSFETFDPPDHGAEVFSETYRIPSRVRDSDVAHRFLGAADDDPRLRKCYLDAKVARATLQAIEPGQPTTRPSPRSRLRRPFQGKGRTSGPASQRGR